MHTIVKQLRDYFYEVDKRILASAIVFTAFAIFCNYYFGLNRYLTIQPFFRAYTGWYLVFLSAFGCGYLLVNLTSSSHWRQRNFLAVFLIAPVIFAWKMSYDPEFSITGNTELNAYWNQVIYWPFKLIVIAGILFLISKLSGSSKEFYGVNKKQHDLKPYFLMLVMMIPLIAAASTQADFLAMYPKLKNIGYLQTDHNTGWYKLLYELSYGSDFFGIELFFRGFLVLGFIKWVGKDAIIPMAMFYCTIHFGKPLGECISSFFGGLILGVVVYHSRTIIGGFIVHVGIAWLMEVGGMLSREW